jgi:membrane protein
MTLIIGFEVNVSMDAVTGRRRQMMREQLKMRNEE